MMPVSRYEIYGRAKAGCIAGLAGGLHGISATIFGVLLHILTAATIGVGFSICSSLHPLLHIRRFWKAVFAGGVTGLEVYAIFFMPITLYIMIPTIDAAASNPAFTASELDAVAVLK